MVRFFGGSEDGFPDTQRGPEWVTEILNKVVGTEEVTDDGDSIDLEMKK